MTCPLSRTLPDIAASPPPPPCSELAASHTEKHLSRSPCLSEQVSLKSRPGLGARGEGG